MSHQSVTAAVFLLNLLSISTANSVLPYVPVVFEGRDIMEYWNSNSSVKGNIPYNVTSKDDNGIERIYQLWFSTQDNLDTFKQNQTHYLPQYGGFWSWGLWKGVPLGIFNATHLGPPGGFSAEFYGWMIYQDKLWINAEYSITEKWFTNFTQKNEQVNAYWISWFGSLDEGVLNFACISEDTQNAEHYCTSLGQPYAPAANVDDEIFEIIDDTKQINKRYIRGL